MEQQAQNCWVLRPCWVCVPALPCTEQTWEMSFSSVSSHGSDPEGLVNDATLAGFTLTANPLRSATTDPTEALVLGTVSVLVPRRWTLDIGILNSRLTT